MKFLSVDRLHIGMLVETMFWGKSMGTCMIVSYVSEFTDSITILSSTGLHIIDFIDEAVSCNMIEI